MTKGKKTKETAQDKRKRESQEKKQKIIDVYLDALKEDNHVTMHDMITRGITKDMVTHHFRSLSKLTGEVREKHPEAFFDEYVDRHISPEYIKSLGDVIASHKRFIVTTAVTGRQVDVGLLEAMESYCANNDAHILVLISSDPATNSWAPGARYGTIDSRIMASNYTSLVVTDVALNSNICLSTVKVSAKQIDAVTGFDRIIANRGTFVFASPKQRLKAVPVSNIKYPHFGMTTGAITVSDYSSDNYMSLRTAFLAENDHVMGGLILEIKDDDIYFFRQFQSKDGGSSFVDLGYRYHADGRVTEECAEAFVLGDWHSGSTDPKASDAWKSVCKRIGIEKLILHDTFDGMSINHHERDDVVSRAVRVKNNQHDLETELVGMVRDLNELCEWAEHLVIVKSNHDEFLERYLRRGYYVQDPQNHRYALDLAAALMDGKDPLKHAIEDKGFLNKDRVTWLSRDEDFKVAGIQLGAHGDKGPNGSRGSVRSMEKSYGQSVTGHSHTPEILRGAWQTGTSTYLKLEYNKGPSSWLQSSCLVYADGSRQIINVIEGEYTTLD
jgi:hypothetical protein